MELNRLQQPSFYVRCFVFCVFLFSCKKEKSESLTPVQVFSTGENILLHEFEILSDGVWMACGGIRDERGVVCRSEDAGITWSCLELSDPKSVYCFDFLNDSVGFCGGDFLHLWKTMDGGKSWTFYWLGDRVPVHEEDRPGIKDFQFVSDSSWYFCGGENFGEGVVYESKNAGLDWQFIFQQHEFRDLTFFDSGHAIAAGHGKVLVIPGSIEMARSSDFDGDFITSSIAIGSDDAVAVSYNGGIYASSNRGQNWTRIEDINKPFSRRVLWNDLDASGSYLCAIGNDGNVAESFDSGNRWTFSVVDEEPDLLSVKVYNKRVYATTSKGEILQLR